MFLDGGDVLGVHGELVFGEGALLVEVGIHGIVGGGPVGQVEVAVYFFHGGERGIVEFLIGDFDEVFRWNLVAGIDEPLHEQRISLDNVVFNFCVGEGVESDLADDGVVEFDGGFIDFVGVAVDVDEFCVGVKFQQLGDTCGVTGVLEYKAVAFGGVGGFFEGGGVGVFPALTFFVGDGVEEGVFVEELHPVAGEVPANVGGVGGVVADGHVFFLGRRLGEVYLVHGAGVRGKAIEEGLEGVEPDEVGTGHDGLKGVEVGEIGVLAEEVVEVGGAGAPVPEDENGGVLEGVILDGFLVEELFEESQRCVES